MNKTDVIIREIWCDHCNRPTDNSLMLHKTYQSLKELRAYVWTHCHSCHEKAQRNDEEHKAELITMSLEAWKYLVLNP